MTHEELRDRLLDLAYGELSPRDAREVEEHAATCEPCRAELASLRGTRRVMAALPVEPAPEGGERVLLAAAREAVRARPPRRAWPRWLWAAPVLASLAVVVALSLRLGPVRPPSAGREDPDALRGESPYALQAPPPGAAPGRPDEAARAEKGAAAVRRERPAARKAEAPEREAEPRFATAPEAPGRAAPPERRGPGALAADREGSASAQAAAPAPPPAPSAAPLPPASAAPEPGAAAALDAEAPSAGAAAGPGPASPPAQGPAADEIRREAAPARRAAKALAAPGAASAAREVSARERAIAAASAEARRVGVDPRGMAIGVEGPTTLEGWRARDVSVAAPAALAGRRFWAVAFTSAEPGARPALTVFVEDGSFRPLAEVAGR